MTRKSLDNFGDDLRAHLSQELEDNSGHFFSSTVRAESISSDVELVMSAPVKYGLRFVSVKKWV